MKTTNNSRTLMTPGVTAAPFSEAMPASPHNGHEVIAVNVGSSTYTLTGAIDGGSSLVLDAGESAILVWAGAQWATTWNSGGGGVTYPITAVRGGLGADNSGASDGDVPIFDEASGTFIAGPQTGSGGVTLQPSLPGTPDTGGINVSLGGIFGDTLAASSLAGATASFQASATDGSNGNPTFVLAGNTLQTAFLAEYRGTDGTTPVANIGVDGNHYLPLIADLTRSGPGLMFSDTDMIQSNTALQTNLIVKGFLAQTAPLTQWYVDDGNGGTQLATLGRALSAGVAIGSGFGVDATVDLVVDAPGIAGNAYTVELVEGTGDDPLSAAFVSPTLTVTLGMSSGSVDPTQNTATLVMGVINGLSCGITASLPGTGADSLSTESQLFFGGSESLTLAGGASIANTLYGSSLAGPSALFQTSATDGSNTTPTLVARANTAQTSPVFQVQNAANVPAVSFGVPATLNGTLNFLSEGEAALIIGGPLESVLGIQQGDNILEGAGISFYAKDSTATDIAGGVGVKGYLITDGDGVGALSFYLGAGFQGDAGPSRVGYFENQSFEGSLHISGNLVLDGSVGGAKILSPAGQNLTLADGDATVSLVLGAATVYTPGTVDAALFSASGTGIASHASIGTGADGTVNMVDTVPGIVGNGYTVEVVVAAGADDNASAAFIVQALTVTLGKTSGTLDPAKNTATIIAGLINAAAGGLTATASGTGGDPLTGAEGPTSFTGGAEAITSAGGFSYAGAGLYLTALPGSDPGIPGALYQTAGAVMVSL